MNPSFNHKTAGYLLLLLTLLVLHFLKPALIPSRPSGSGDEGHLFIQVEGDMKFPAVYAFNRPPNLTQLINRAGGLSSNGVLPEKFKDLTFSSGMKVAIRMEGVATRLYQSEMSAFYRTTLGMLPIHLNRESETGLTAIPGIGLGLAKAIVDERSKRGGFRSLDELLSINGIGEKLYRKITPYLTIQKKKRPISMGR
jgi:competence protein ComEA